MFFSDQWCELLETRIKWIKENLRSDAKVFVNFRDFSDAMYNDIGPVLKITLFLGLLPPELRPFGLMFEEPRATYLPEEIGKWCGGKFYHEKDLCIIFPLLLDGGRFELMEPFFFAIK